jgi:hypothetical protein
VDVRRLRIQDAFAALFGALLFGSLFLDWYSQGIEGAYFDRAVGADGVTGVSSSPGANAWEAFAVTDVLLATAALMGVGIGLLGALYATPAIPAVWTTFTSIVTGIAALWLTARTLFPPGDDPFRELGATVAPALAWLLTISSWSAMRNDRPGPARRRELNVERLPAPPAAG